MTKRKLVVIAIIYNLFNIISYGLTSGTEWFRLFCFINAWVISGMFYSFVYYILKKTPHEHDSKDVSHNSDSI